MIHHGALGTNAETEIPLWFSTVTKLPVNDGLIWVRYQVTNFHHARGGFQYSPVLGIIDRLALTFIGNVSETWGFSASSL